MSFDLDESHFETHRQCSVCAIWKHLRQQEQIILH